MLKQPRSRIFYVGVFLCAVMAVVSPRAFLASPARAGEVQMLPPVDFAGQPCAGSNSGMLLWDGVNPIRCIPGFTGNAAGGITAKNNFGIGTAAPIGTLDVENGKDTATICLNGKCSTTLDPLPSCAPNQLLGTDSWGNMTCLNAPPANGGGAPVYVKKMEADSSGAYNNYVWAGLTDSGISPPISAMGAGLWSLCSVSSDADPTVPAKGSNTVCLSLLCEGAFGTPPDFAMASGYCNVGGGNPACDNSGHMIMAVNCFYD